MQASIRWYRLVRPLKTGLLFSLTSFEPEVKSALIKFTLDRGPFLMLYYAVSLIQYGSFKWPVPLILSLLRVSFSQ